MEGSSLPLKAKPGASLGNSWKQYGLWSGLEGSGERFLGSLRMPPGRFVWSGLHMVLTYLAFSYSVAKAELLAFEFSKSVFGKSRRRLTFCFWVLWAREYIGVLRKP